MLTDLTNGTIDILLKIVYNKLLIMYLLRYYTREHCYIKLFIENMLKTQT